MSRAKETQYVYDVVSCWVLLPNLWSLWRVCDQKRSLNQWIYIITLWFGHFMITQNPKTKLHQITQKAWIPRRDSAGSQICTFHVRNYLIIIRVIRTDVKVKCGWMQKAKHYECVMTASASSFLSCISLNEQQQRTQRNMCLTQVTSL